MSQRLPPPFGELRLLELASQETLPENLKMWKTLILGLVLLLLAGCGARHPAIELAGDDMLPAFLNGATPRVRDAYRFAAANQHELEPYPCYCGCGKIGHTSNLSCYISNTGVDGTITYDEHANGCGICVDITQDVMRLSQADRSAWEIRAYVDTQYSPFGPATDTLLPAKP